MSFNPSADDTIGLEWHVQSGHNIALGVDTRPAVEFVSSATETVDSLAVYLAVNDGEDVVADVYVKGQEVSAAPSVVSYRPNADGAVVSNVTDWAGGFVNFWQSLDEVTLDTSDYVQNDGVGTPVEMTLQFATSGFTGRPTIVKLKGVAQAFDAGTSFTLTPYIRIGGVDYLGTPSTVGSARQTISYSWQVNPATGLPWTQQQIRDMDTSVIELGWKWGSNSSTHPYLLYQTWVAVTYVAENRVATGSITAPTAEAWNTIDLAHPTTGANWSKSNGTTYLAVLHNPTAVGDGTIITRLLGLVDCPHQSYKGHNVTVDGPAGVVTALTSNSLRVPGLLLTLAGGSLSADSQPYAGFSQQIVDTAKTVQQEFTPGGATTGRNIRLAVRRTGTPTASLTVKVKRRSDDTQFGGTATITTSDVAAGLNVAVIEKALVSDAVLVGGTQYYLEVASTAAVDASNYWQVAYLDTLRAQALDLTGAAGTHASTPDTATLDITSDLDLRWKATPDDWTPAALQIVPAKWDATGNQRSFYLGIRPTGVLRLGWSADGSAELTADSTVATGFTDGTTRWVRATIDVNDGAGNRVINFYTSTNTTNDHTQVTWTQLGATVTTAGATSIFSSSSALRVGNRNDGATPFPFAGYVHAGAVLNGIAGTVVANPDFTDRDQWKAGDVSGDTGTDGAGLTWTLAGAATIQGTDANAAAALTFGGTTQMVTVAGDELSQADAPITLATVPTTPSGWSASVNQVDLCADYVLLDWTSTTLGADFEQYEVQRLAEDGTTWQDIALIESEGDSRFRDIEARRGVQESYRLRVRRTDQAVSDWTSTVTATAQPRGECCQIVFTTNEDPELTVCGTLLPDKVFEFPKDETVLRLYNSDYAVGFRELEERGDETTWNTLLYAESNLITAGDNPTPTPGRQSFDDIKALRDARLSYVAVLDADGNRWYGFIQVGQARQDEPGGRYSAQVRMSEVTATPSTPNGNQ